MDVRVSREVLWQKTKHFLSQPWLCQVGLLGLGDCSYFPWKLQLLFPHNITWLSQLLFNCIVIICFYESQGYVLRYKCYIRKGCGFSSFAILHTRSQYTDNICNIFKGNNIMKLLKLSLSLCRIPKINKSQPNFDSYIFILISAWLIIFEKFLLLGVLSNSSGKRKQMVISACLFLTCYLFYILVYVTSS